MNISKQPPFSERLEYLVTREAARAKGLAFYYTGVLCRGEYGQHDDYRYVSNGRCVECKRLENNRRDDRPRVQSPEFKALVKKRDQERHSLGLGFGWRAPGGGVGYRGLIPQGAIAKPDDADTNRAARAKCKGKRQRDHICPVPQKRNFDKLIIGLECGENLQVLNPSNNRKKGGTIPHPDDFTRPAERPLTLNELRWFVQRRMAIWAHDVIFATQKGERATINWHLYRVGAGGLVEYLGVEPTLAEAAE